MKKWLFSFMALFAIAGCNEEKVTFPYRPVYLEVNLTYEDRELLNPYTHKIFTTYKNLSQGLGGVIVFHGSDNGYGPYHAYDLACPNEENAATVIKVDESGLNAVCPKCNSSYELSYGGFGNENNTHRKNLRSYTVQHITAGPSEKLVIQN